MLGSLNSLLNTTILFGTFKAILDKYTYSIIK